MRRREAGSALIITVMLLLLLGVIGLSALDTVTRDQQVAGFQNRSTAAFYAAEAGMARAKDEVRRNYNYAALNEVITTYPTYGNPAEFGDTALYPYGRPSYYADPGVADPLKALEPVNSPGGGGSNMRMGSANWGYAAPYRLRVVGETADGAKAKIEAVVMNRIPGGY
jgi:hypothetical protein